LLADRAVVELLRARVMLVCTDWCVLRPPLLVERSVRPCFRDVVVACFGLIFCQPSLLTNSQNSISEE